MNLYLCKAIKKANQNRYICVSCFNSL